MVPLSHVGRVLGAYALFFAEKRDTPEELGLLFRSISEHLGMALENARLLRENMRMTLMSERQLIANEVHDSLAQTMAYMKIRLAMMQEALEASEQPRALKHAGEVQQALDGAYADLRELLSQFRNRMDPLGLVHALEELEDKIPRPHRHRAHPGQPHHGHRSERGGGRPGVPHHAGSARQRGAALRRQACPPEHGARPTGEYRFAVEDDGLGFYAFGQRLGGAEQHSHLRHHLGVNIMRERAQRLNGSIEIVNLPQGGARVSLVFPAQRGTGSMKPIRVMLVDDHTLFRRGLAELLHGRNDIEVVAATAGATEAARLMQETKPDVLLLDLNLPPHGGLALLRTLQDYGWSGPTLILTVSDSEDDLANALHAGARGYLLKDMEPEDVTDAILRAVRGETVVAPVMTMKLVDLLQPGTAEQDARKSAGTAHRARARDPRSPGAGHVEQGDRARARHQL